MAELPFSSGNELRDGRHPANWLTARIAATPQKTALVFRDQSWTYAELGAEVAAYTAGLKEQGVRPGDRVGLLLPNRPDTVFYIHALAQIGAILVPLNTRLAPAEVADQVARAGVGLVIKTGMGNIQHEAGNRNPIKTKSLAEFRNQQSPIENPQSAVHSIVYTSGTTGRAKGALITYANHFWSALGSAFRLGVLPEDRWLSVLPLYHVGGLAVVWRSCLYGTAMVLHERFDLERVNESLDRDGITLISLVPTMLYRLLESREKWPESLRLVLLGGAAATVDLISRSHEAGVPVTTTYGLTEAASQVATLLPAGVRRKPGSVGRPLLFTRVRVVDEAGQSLPAGQPGEVVVSGPTVMAGYDGDPEATAGTIKNGELFTGDIGYLDEDGDLWVVQRRSDLIVSGGENVVPAEVEEVLRRHPAVQAVCVVGVPDDEWGQQVAAMVVVRSGREVTEEALTAYCRDHVAGYKIPRLYRFVDALPQTASGKVSRPGVLATFKN